MKYIRKIDCVRADFAHNIIRERRILQEVQHPLIVNLRYAFQDEEFMYMVSDLMYHAASHIMTEFQVGGRFTIPYKQKDILRRSGQVLDCRGSLRSEISAFSWHRPPVRVLGWRLITET